MFESGDVVFAWAMGKALLIVIVSLGILVYLAWAVTRNKEIVPHAEILEDGVLRSRSAAKASEVPFIAPGTTGEAEGARHILPRTSAEENNTRQSEQPAAAA